MIDADGLVVGTGEPRTIAAQLVVRSVGYRGLRLAGVPFDEAHRPGPARRGPGHPRRWLLGRRVRHRLDQARPDRGDRHQQSDAVETVPSLLADVAEVACEPDGRDGDLDRLLAERGITPLDLPAWHRIDAAEIELGQQHGRLRTTLAHRRSCSPPPRTTALARPHAARPRAEVRR